MPLPEWAVVGNLLRFVGPPTSRHYKWCVIEHPPSLLWEVHRIGAEVICLSSTDPKYNSSINLWREHEGSDWGSKDFEEFVQTPALPFWERLDFDSV